MTNPLDGQSRQGRNWLQRFDVTVTNTDTGESWEVSVTSEDPARALAKVLRRHIFAEFLLSEQRFRFVVKDNVIDEIRRACQTSIPGPVM